MNHHRRLSPSSPPPSSPSTPRLQPPLLDSDEDDYEQITMKSKPRAAFELSSPPPSEPPTPSASSPSATTSYLHAQNSSQMDESAPPSRTRSFMNLTSSTLFGIFQPGDYHNPDRDEAATPWGTGAQTPAHGRTSQLDMSRVDKVLGNGTTSFKSRRKPVAQSRTHRQPPKGFRGYFLPRFGRVIALYATGLLYSLLITHLHDRQALAPTKVDINRSSWTYFTWWGLTGVALGEALPWVDTFWAPEDEEEAEHERTRRAKDSKRARNTKGQQDAWMDVVRSIGAFVGVAFAIRKLPWQSTLQLSLTLALANPAIWFIVDRSPPGFVLSTIFSLVGTLFLLGMNPALVPSPSPAEVLRAHVQRNGGSVTRLASALGNEDLILGIFTQESVGVATWIASVLFVSSVCFGNIGRRLAL